MASDYASKKLSSALTSRTISALGLWTLLLFCAAPGHGFSERPSQPPQPIAERRLTRQPMRQSTRQPVVEARREGGEAAKPRIPDVEVLDQNGRKLRFYSDLIKGKTVAVNFIFTTCTYVCPMQGGNFSKLQLALGDRLGKDVHLISVSTDPSTDTPERLKAWGAKYGVRPGWTLVTGGKSEIDQLLKELTGEPAGTGKHAPAALIGNFDRGLWSGIYGLAEPERYLSVFARIANDPAATR